MYKDQIIHFFGGMHEYVGELDQKEHKMGKGWYRILNPCLVSQTQDPETKTLTNILIPLPGSGNAYKKYVDFRIPEDFVIEIRTIHKGGRMYEIYKQEVERPVADRIHIPESSSVVPFH